ANVGAEGGREPPLPRDLDVPEAEPRTERAELGAQRLDERAEVDVLLELVRADGEAAATALRLEVEPGDEAVTEEEWKDVVAVGPGVGRGVDRDPVVEAK